MAIANRISRWGIASLVLLVAGYAFVDYSGYLYEQHRKMLFRYWAEVNQFALVRIGCRWLWDRRGTTPELLVGTSVGVAALLSLVFFFGDM